MLENSLYMIREFLNAHDCETVFSGYTIVYTFSISQNQSGERVLGRIALLDNSVLFQATKYSPKGSAEIFEKSQTLLSYKQFINLITEVKERWGNVAVI